VVRWFVSLWWWQRYVPPEHLFSARRCHVPEEGVLHCTFKYVRSEKQVSTFVLLVMLKLSKISTFGSLHHSCPIDVEWCTEPSRLKPPPTNNTHTLIILTLLIFTVYISHTPFNWTNTKRIDKIHRKGSLERKALITFLSYHTYRIENNGSDASSRGHFNPNKEPAAPSAN
jgi:hypothetical protein